MAVLEEMAELSFRTNTSPQENEVIKKRTERQNGIMAEKTFFDRLC